MSNERPFWCQELADAGDNPYFPEFLYPDDPAGWRWANIDGHWFTYIAYAPLGCRTPIYVGYTNNIYRRLSEHRKEKAWWPLIDRIIVDCYDSQREALDQEARFIGHLRPIVNVAGNCHA